MEIDIRKESPGMVYNEAEAFTEVTIFNCTIPFNAVPVFIKWGSAWNLYISGDGNDHLFIQFHGDLKEKRVDVFQ